MRRLLLILAVTAAVVGMFKYPDEVRAKTSAACAKISEFFASLAGEKGRAASQTTAPVPMGDGIYCLTKPTLFTHAGGSTLQPAGALVRKKGEGGGGKLLVTDEVGNAVVEASALTRDPSAVSRMTESARAAAPASAQSTPAIDAETAKQRIKEIDAKLQSLRTELANIQVRDQNAARWGRKVVFATNQTFVQSTIHTLEQQKAQLMGISTSPPQRK